GGLREHLEGQAELLCLVWSCQWAASFRGRQRATEAHGAHQLCSRSLSPSRIRPARSSAGVPVGSIITVGACASISATRGGSRAPSSAPSAIDSGRVPRRVAGAPFGSVRITGG